MSILSRGPSRCLPLRSFLTRLGLLAALPVLCAYMTASYAYLKRSRESYLSNAETHALNLAKAVDRRLDYILDGLTMLAASPYLDAPEDLAAFHSVAARFRSVYGIHVILADLDSNMLLNTRTPYGTALPRLPVPRGHAAVPEVLRTGRPSIGDSFMGPVAGESLIAAVVPVTRADSVHRLLLGTPELRLFQGLLDAIPFPEAWIAVLLDGKGDEMARLGQAGLSEESVRNLGYEFSERVGSSNWELKLYAPRSELIGGLLREGAGWLVALLLSLGATSLIGIVYGRRMISTAEALILGRGIDAEAAPILEIRQVAEKLRAIEDQRDQSLRLLELFIENMPAAVAMFDRDMRYISCSRRFLADYRLGNRDIRGLSHYEVFPDIPEGWKEIHRRCLEGAVERCERDPFPRSDGSTDWVRWELRPWNGSDGAVGGLVLFSEVITGTVESERRIERSLEEKELLLQELLHRTNNNMQGIQALMLLYSQVDPGADLPGFVNLMTGRIAAMATVYRLLIDSSDLSRVDFGEYLESVGRAAAERVPGKTSCALDLDIESIPVLFDVVVAVALAVLELFDLVLLNPAPDGEGPTLRVRLRREGTDSIALTVSGFGGSSSQISEHRKVLALELADQIVREQIKGTLERSDVFGVTGWTIRFNDKQYTQRVSR